jgi:hypothetical protein
MKKFQISVVILLATIFNVGFSNAQVVSTDNPNYKHNVITQKSDIIYTLSDEVFQNISPQKQNNILQGETEDASITWMVDETEMNGIGATADNAQWYCAMVLEPEDINYWNGIYAIRTIKGIQFAISSAYVSNVLNCKALVFQINGNSIVPLVTVDVPDVVGGWNVVTFPTPLDLSSVTSTTYIGYYFVQSGTGVYPVSLNGEKISKQSFAIINGSKNDLSSNGSIRIKADATVENMGVDYNMAITELSLERTIPVTTTTINIPITVMNRGKYTVNSLEVEYKIGDNPTDTKTFGSLNIPSAGKYKLNLDIPNTGIGFQTFEVTITKINGDKEDMDNSDNTKSGYFSVTPTDIQRLVLHEGFTSSTCGPCKAGNANVKSIQDANPGKFVNIKYQMSWPGTGDPYYTTEGMARRSYYDVSAVPWFFANGHAWEGNSGSYTNGTLNSFYAIPAQAQFNDATSTINGKTVNFSVDLVPAFDIQANEQCRFFAAIVEKVTYKNKKTNGETEFENVMKKFLTPTTGTNIGAVGFGITKHFDLSWEFKGEYRLPANGGDAVIINNNIEHSVEDFDNLIVVYWLQDFATGYVYQAGATDIITSISETTNSNINSIYPNPTKGGLTIDLKESSKVSVWSVDGNKIFEADQTEGISNINLNTTPGNYILRTEGKSGIFSTKFVIEK